MSARASNDGHGECDLSRPGHLIVSERCRWWAHAHVGDYCISAVGEFYPRPDSAEPEEIGPGRLYEVMVFNLARIGERWTEVASATANRRSQAAKAYRLLVAEFRGIRVA